MRRFLCLAAVSAGVAMAQAFDPGDGPLTPQINLIDGPAPVSISFHLPDGFKSAQAQFSADQFSIEPLAVTGLAFYTANYLALNSFHLPFNIVGTDPSLGANTTTIPTVLVPLKFVFPNPGNPTLDGSNVAAATLNSPIFQSAPYAAGAIDLGVTQFGDALQRAEFWNLPGFSPDYHVLLTTPSVAPAITIAIPAGRGNAYALANGRMLGVVDTTYFTQLLATLLPGYSATQLPIFLTDNVFLGTGGLLQNCCTLGYHSSQNAPLAMSKTWIYAAYTEPGTYSGDVILDVQPLSHEVAEWLNDPFVSSNGINFIPPAALGSGCIINFETGDPLESPPAVFTKVTNSTTYHLQDEVLLPWYLHTDPSFSANAWYTFQNVTGVVPLVINSPPGISGTYKNTASLNWAPVDKEITADVAYVGQGCPAGSINGTNPEDPYASDPAGKIALIESSGCAISLKVDRAAKAGAAGVVIGRSFPGPPISFAYGGGSNFVPSLVISQADANILKNALASATVNATLSPANAIPAPPSVLCGPG